MSRSATFEKALGLAILAACVGIAWFVSTTGSGAKPRAGSVASNARDGRAAFAALLRHVGRPASEWRRPPGELPRRPVLLWLPRAPESVLPHAAELDTGRGRSGPPPRVGVHDAEHYVDFLERGGTLLLAGNGATTRFVVDVLGLDEPPDVVPGPTFESRDPYRVRTSSGEVVTTTADTSFEAVDPNGAWTVAWTVSFSDEDRPFVITATVGAGRVVLIADETIASNEEIGRADNALALVRCLEEFDHGEPVLFGEYELGRFDPPSATALAFGPRTALVTLHGLVLLLVFAWAKAYPRAFPRDPEAHELFSPLQRAQGLAGAFVRGERLGELAVLARRATWERLAARTRLPAPAGAELASPAAEDVAAWARRAGCAPLEARLVEALATRRVSTRADLAALDAALLAVEASVTEHVRARRARTDFPTESPRAGGADAPSGPPPTTGRT